MHNSQYTALLPTVKKYVLGRSMAEFLKSAGLQRHFFSSHSVWIDFVLAPMHWQHSAGQIASDRQRAANSGDRPQQLLLLLRKERHVQIAAVLKSRMSRHNVPGRGASRIRRSEIFARRVSGVSSLGSAAQACWPLEACSSFQKRTLKPTSPIASSADCDRPLWPSCCHPIDFHDRLLCNAERSVEQRGGVCRLWVGSHLSLLRKADIEMCGSNVRSFCLHLHGVRGDSAPTNRTFERLGSSLSR